jgi:hypothetical protein
MHERVPFAVAAVKKGEGRTMKGRIVVALALALGLGVGGEAMARRGVPVQNYDNVPIVRADNATLTGARVREAIVRAAQQNKWVVGEDTPGFVVATFSIKGKHSLTVGVRYSETQFSIEYRDSSNLNYAQGAGGAAIHPAYNKEVKILFDAINAGLRGA